jgi:hypothetical protein
MSHSRFFLAVGLLLVGHAVAANNDRQLLDRLRVNHDVMLAAEQDYHARQQRGSLNTIEASDYAAYIARLHRLVAEDCAALAKTGSPPLPELGCPEQAPVFLAPVAIDQAREQTIDEQLAALDAELLGGLGDFDEMLLREQERIRAATPRVDADPADAAAGSGVADADSAGESGLGNAESGGESDKGDQSSSGRGQGMGSGARRQGGGQATPRDIPDGSDDDVVARQLREAAEKETSPALKEKLWDEYRKYKAGTR